MQASGTGDPNVTNINFIGMVRPGAQVGVDFRSTKKFKNLVLRGEIGYYKYVDSGDGVVPASADERPRTVKYDVIILLLKPSVNLIYKFISTPGFEAYLGAGYVGNFSINPRNRMRVDYLDDGSAELSDSYHKIETYWGQGIVKGGVIIGKRFEAGINFPFAGSFLQYPDLTVKPGNTSLQFNYRFK